MDKKFKNKIEKLNIKDGSSILICVSGGMDSMCLLNLFYRLSMDINLKIIVCHFNHSIREQSDSDEKFVIDYSKKLDLPCFTRKVDVIKYCKENKLSTETGARKLRYDFFREIKIKENIDYIATAHNKNDLAETVLMRIIRGTGINGLIGIKEENEDLIRPILDFSRIEIENYIKLNNIPYVQDDTNFMDIYNRNRIRLNLIPKIESEFNEKFIDSLARLSSISYDYRNISLEYIKSKENYLWNFIDDRYIIKTSELVKESKSFRGILYREFFEKISKNPDGISFQIIDEIDKLIYSNSGKFLKIKDVVFKNEYGNILIYKYLDSRQYKNFEFKNLKLALYSTGFFDIIIGKSNYDEFRKFKENKEYFFINEKFLSSIKIRSRKNGDFINLKFGKKKLKDLFIDEKISKDIRDLIPIFEINGEIIWVSNIKRTSHFLVKENDNIIKIRVLKGE